MSFVRCETDIFYKNMDLKNFTSAITQIAEEKGIPVEKIIESIEAAVAAAYKKDYGRKSQIVRAKLNPETGDLKFWQVKLVVSPDMIYSEQELEELKTVKKTEEHKESEEGGKIHFGKFPEILSGF